MWNEDIDLSEYELWKNAMTVAEGERSDVAIEEIEDAIEEVMQET